MQKLLGCQYCKKYKAQTSRFAFLFCNIIVDIFHHTILVCNYTREMYRRSPHLLPLLINLKYGDRKVEMKYLATEKVERVDMLKVINPLPQIHHCISVLARLEQE
jgi:hypothetical protein